MLRKMLLGIVFGFVGLATLGALLTDDRTDYVNVQRALIARLINVDRGAISTTDVRRSHVTLIEDGLAHVESQYSTPLGGPLHYQMIVRRVAGDRYRSDCFWVAEADDPSARCF